MPQIGTLEGNGELFDGDRSLGTVKYELEVWQSQDWQGKDQRTAGGELIGSDRTLGGLIGAGQVTLVLADGQKITVLNKRRDSLLGHGRAEVVVKVGSSLPGFGSVI
jgi:hypothetical protein